VLLHNEYSDLTANNADDNNYEDTMTKSREIFTINRQSLVSNRYFLVVLSFLEQKRGWFTKEFMLSPSWMVCPSGHTLHALYNKEQEHT
jgi:hypothetical protein